VEVILPMSTIVPRDRKKTLGLNPSYGLDVRATAGRPTTTRLSHLNPRLKRLPAPRLPPQIFAIVRRVLNLAFIESGKKTTGGSSMKHFSLTTRVAVFAAALIFWLSPAALHAQAVTSSLQVPLAGTVFVPLSDGSFDGVALSGFAHVFSYVRTLQPGGPPIADPFRIQINLDQISGVGDVTGFRYQGMGAFRINLPTAPVDPINVSFDLLVAGVPPNPIFPNDPIMPLDIVFLVNFLGDTLNNFSIQSMSVPVP
jgi:hypothetical protein